MSCIKSKNTAPELIVRKFLFANGYRYRLHNKKLAGTPDITMFKYRIAIFINGCFWHRHSNCRYATLPKTRTDWWESKLNKNVQNDNLNRDRLAKENWQVITLWTCQLKKNTCEQTLSDLIAVIRTRKIN